MALSLHQSRYTTTTVLYLAYVLYNHCRATSKQYSTLLITLQYFSFLLSLFITRYIQLVAKKEHLFKHTENQWLSDSINPSTVLYHYCTFRKVPGTVLYKVILYCITLHTVVQPATALRPVNSTVGTVQQYINYITSYQYM